MVGPSGFEVYVAGVLGDRDEEALLGLWRAQGQRDIWEQVAASSDAADYSDHRRVAARALAELPEVGPVEALAANRCLVEVLVSRRWSVMRAARERGVSWREIGEALGMTKQGAQDWYRRKIAEQEAALPDLHDANRARAVLAYEDPAEDGATDDPP